MTVLAGIDLAWSGRNPTGLCVVSGEGARWKLERLECLPNAAAAEIAELLDSLGPDVVAGIDAPLIVGPQRRAEAHLARSFGSLGVYAYAARQDFLERHGIVEGPRLGRLLRAMGWSLDPRESSWPGRHALEVFPHATIVSLLGAKRALRYKKGAIAARLGPLTEFQARLRTHAEAHLPCLLEDAAETLTARPVVTSGRALKDLEDRLDAVACVLAAHHAHRFGGAGLELFGDLDNGYISVPKPVAATSVLAPSSP